MRVDLTSTKFQESLYKYSCYAFHLKIIISLHAYNNYLIGYYTLHTIYIYDICYFEKLDQS